MARKPPKPVSVTSFAKMMEQYGPGTFTHPTTTTMTIPYITPFGGSATGAPISAPLTSVAPSSPPVKPISERQLEVAERIATALETIVERFC